MSYLDNSDLGQTPLISGGAHLGFYSKLLGLLGASILFYMEGATHPPAREPGLFHVVTEFPKQQELKLRYFQNLHMVAFYCILWSNQVIRPAKTLRLGTQTPPPDGRSYKVLGEFYLFDK